MKSPARQGTYLRGGVWFLHIALPLIVLWILLARREVDAHVQHNPTHFWLVALVARVPGGRDSSMRTSTRTLS